MKRRYDIDALRVFAFGLLILYHVGMFYVAEWDWHVKSAYQYDRTSAAVRSPYAQEHGLIYPNNAVSE